MSTKGLGSPEVGANYTQALELCRQLGERPLAQARETSALFNEAELHRLRGELLLRGPAQSPTTQNVASVRLSRSRDARTRSRSNFGLR
jgi:hypothetical protein